MTVDVTWDGVALARGATVREQDGGWFVELEQPMPVGTPVVLTGDVQATAAVARVHEGPGAGMLVRAAISQQPSAVSSGAEEAAKDGGGGEPAKDNGGEAPKDNGGDKKEKRKRRR